MYKTTHLYKLHENLYEMQCVTSHWFKSHYSEHANCLQTIQAQLNASYNTTELVKIEVCFDDYCQEFPILGFCRTRIALN